MTKFSQEDGIEDILTDTIGVLAKKIRTSQSRNLVYSDLRNQLDKAIKTSKYLVFTANVTNYGTWSVGESKLLYVPDGRRGALSIFQDKTVRLVCIGSGRFTRLLAAASVKLEPRIHSKVIKQFELNQEYLNQKKSTNESHLKKYLREMRIRGSHRSDGMTFVAAKEVSSMASVWTEILALQKQIDGRWKLHQGKLEILGSIYDLEEDKIYDEEGNLVIPKSYCGQRIVGLADGEYLVTNKFESEFESNPFLPKEFGIYRPFLVEHEWMEVAIFRQISNIVGF